ncbi:MAG: anti-sigma regulatory factor [Syntrophomonadaceae bacterium]
MTIQRSDKRIIRSSEDIVMVRQLVREWAKAIGMSLVDQTKLITAASELARNTFDYGGGGVMLMDQITQDFKTGLRLTFEDKGPGIADVEQAIKDGFTTGGGMGLGLGGARRLANEFYIETNPGHGTRVTIIRWK